MKLTGHRCCMCGKVNDYTLCEDCLAKLPGDEDVITIPSNDGLVTITIPDVAGKEEK